MAQLYIFQFFFPSAVFSRSENEIEDQCEFVCLVIVRMTSSQEANSFNEIFTKSRVHGNKVYKGEFCTSNSSKIISKHEEEDANKVPDLSRILSSLLETSNSENKDEFARGLALCLRPHAHQICHY